jgi:hypothetical protein
MTYHAFRGRPWGHARSIAHVGPAGLRAVCFVVVERGSGESIPAKAHPHVDPDSGVGSMKNWLKCPWCETTLGFHARLGSRPSQKRPKWYQLSRTVSVCPYCGNPVKPTVKSQLWTLLCAPFFLSLLIQSLLPSTSIPQVVFWSSIVLAIAGILLYVVSTRLEKASEN